jgi:hypothetical protein
MEKTNIQQKMKYLLEIGKGNARELSAISTLTLWGVKRLAKKYPKAENFLYILQGILELYVLAALILFLRDAVVREKTE